MCIRDRSRSRSHGESCRVAPESSPSAFGERSSVWQLGHRKLGRLTTFIDERSAAKKQPDLPRMAHPNVLKTLPWCSVGSHERAERGNRGTVVSRNAVTNSRFVSWAGVFLAIAALYWLRWSGVNSGNWVDLDVYVRGAQAIVTGAPLYEPPVSYTHLRAHETVLDLVCR